MQAGLLILIRQRPTLPHTRACSTIGAEELNFRVRNGNGCCLFAMATENCKKITYGLLAIILVNYLKYGQDARPISTGKLSLLPDLHTRPINLVVYQRPSVRLLGGTSYLGVGFPLRCFQWLSIPNLATQRCFWRNSWNTSGSSIPVLSYWR